MPATYCPGGAGGHGRPRAERLQRGLRDRGAPGHGSGTFSTVVTVEGPSGDALYQSATKAVAHSDAPLTVERYTSGSESGAKISAPFKSLDDLTALSRHLGSSTGLGGVTGHPARTGWRFTAHADGGLARAPAATETGAPGGVIDGSQLSGLIHMSVSVELPGAPGTTNADTVTHTATTSRFVWTLAVGRVASDLTATTTFVGAQGAVALATALTPLKSDGGSAPAATHRSTSSGALGGGAIAGIAVGGAVVLIAAAVAAALIKRSRRSRAA